MPQEAEAGPGVSEQDGRRFSDQQIQQQATVIQAEATELPSWLLVLCSSRIISSGPCHRRWFSSPLDRKSSQKD